jgi:excisionase family DNA binding protein
MGSDFVSIAEAAKTLKRSKRTVVSYLKNGLLHRERVGRKTLIPVADVESLLVELGVDLPAMNRKTFYQLVARVQRLEMTSAVLQRATGIGASPLRPSKDEALGLYEAAQRALGTEIWRTDELDLWADMYEKMDEVFFDIVGSYIAVTDAWRPFYTLCVAQARRVSQHQGFEKDLHLQQLHDRLRLSMKMMRGVVLAWVELGGGSATAVVDPLDDLSRRLSAKRLAPTG